MTIICAINDPRIGTVIGSDRRTTWGTEYVDFADKWVFLDDKRAIAACGASRARHLLTANKVVIAEAGDIYALSDVLYELIAEDGWKPNESIGDPPSFEARFVYATDRRIWVIGADFTVDEAPPNRLVAYGSGGDFAAGAAHALQQNGTLIHSIIVRSAIDAAIAHDNKCGGEPFVMEIHRKVG